MTRPSEQQDYFFSFEKETTGSMTGPTHQPGTGVAIGRTRADVDAAIVEFEGLGRLKERIEIDHLLTPIDVIGQLLQLYWGMISQLMI